MGWLGQVPPTLQLFVKHDPNCPAVWPVCYIPPGKLPIYFDDCRFITAHSVGGRRQDFNPSHIAGRISWSAASVQSIRGPVMPIATLKTQSNAPAREES